MADIASYQSHENMEDDALCNWRGDQVSAPVGQSIFKTSAVKLDELGARKVVGDRVFRYALAAGTVNAGDLIDSPTLSANVIKQTVAAVAVAGEYRVKCFGADAIAAGAYNDGYLHMQTLGHTYKVKSQPAISSAGSSYVTLYSPIKTNYAITDVYSLIQNPYNKVIQSVDPTGTGGYPIGVAPIHAVSGDYFWLQTWGPCACTNDDATVIGQPVIPSTAGTIGLPIATTGLQIGYAMQVATAAERCLTWLTIAP